MAFLLLVAGSVVAFRLVHRSSLPDRVGAHRGLRTSLGLLLLAVALMVAANAVGGPLVPAVGMLAAGALLGAAVAIREALRAREREEQEELRPEA